MVTPANPIEGLITWKQRRLIERYFPGILALYQKLDPKPKTFLELVWCYQQQQLRTRRS